MGKNGGNRLMMMYKEELRTAVYDCHAGEDVVK